MGKVRVYSLAQELDIKSNVLLDWLKEMGNEVQSHMSAIEDDIAEILRNRAKQLQSGPKAKESEPVREVTKPAAAEMQKEVRSNTVKDNHPREEAKNDGKPQHEAKPQQNARPQHEVKPEEDGKPQQNSRPQNDGRPQQNNRPQNDGRPQQNSRPQNDGRPQQNARPQNDGRLQQNSRPQNDGRPQQNSRPQNDGRPQQNSRPQNDGRPQQNARPQNDGRPQQNARPQNDGRPQQNGRPQNEGRPQQNNRPQNEGRPQQNGRPQNEGRPQQNGRPQNEMRPQEGRPQQNNRPQHDGKPQNDVRRDARPGNGQDQRRDNRPNQPDMRRDGRPQNNDLRKDARPNQGDVKKDFKATDKKDMPKTAAPIETRDTRENRDKGREAKFESVEKRKEKQHQDGAGKKDFRAPGIKANPPKGPAKRPDADREAFAAEVAEEISTVPNKKVLEIELPVTVKTLAEGLNVNPNSIIAKLIGLGVMATINQNLDPEAIELIADEFGHEVVFKTQEDKFKLKTIEDRPEDMQPRPPIVTIMGHVDHGKTSLLDVIRHTNVTATEAGGITQHIGAYQATINGKKITFLDTPGHEAFTAMRARGAQLTDIAVLVVAADDGVMPQTIEAINHAKAAGIQIIVAVNKIDKDNANPDRVLQELSEHGLIPEAWGGDTICVHVSALKKTNIEGLLEMIILVAEMQEMKANPNRPADGVVVEAELDKGRGPVATVLVKRGTLKVGDPIVAGTTFGRVRAMINDKGERVEKATPATPVVVLGLSDVPSAGDTFEVAEDDKIARAVADERAQKKRLEEMQTKRAITLDDLFKHIKEGEVKDLNLIIKADVQGSVEAVQSSLVRLSTDEVRVTPIHTGVGAINESDVMLANTSNAIIIGFNVRPDLNARKMAERDNVEIRTYRVIYQAIEEVKAALEGLLEPEHKEVVIGRAEVRAVFKVPKIGSIAGMYVTDGKITRNANVRLLRNGVVIHEGKISSLKRFQDDVKEVAQSYECGLGIEGYNDIKEGDEVEVYVIEEIRRTLD